MSGPAPVAPDPAGPGGPLPLGARVRRLRGATLADGTRADVTLDGGRVRTVEPAGTPRPGTVTVDPDQPGCPAPSPGADPVRDLDLSGHLLLPALVEPHTHLDKALVGSLGAAPGLVGAIAAWVADYPHRDLAETTGRARTALREYVRHGTGTVRTHVDVDPAVGPVTVEALVALRAELGTLVRLEIVAMPPVPLTGRAGASSRAALLDALAAGADLVGGAPWLDPEPRTALELLLQAAHDHGTGVDLHVDEALAPPRSTVLDLVDAVDAGFAGPVVAGHVVALGQAPGDEQRHVAAELARTGVTVVANPRTSLWLQDRTATTAAPRGLTAVRTLLDAGVSVRAGADNLRDPFNPYGTADPLQVAQLLALVADVRTTEALGAVTTAGLLVRPGDAADLVALPASGPEEALATAPAARTVLHAGRLVARRTLDEQTADR